MVGETALYILNFSTLLSSLLIYRDGKAQEDPAKTIHSENGYKEYHYGIPFLYLEGTNYEAGQQHGTLLQNEPAAMHEEFEKFKSHMMENEIHYLPWYERIFTNVSGGMVWDHKIDTFADKFSPNIEEQIRGASDGSGLPESFFREIQAVDEYAKGLDCKITCEYFLAETYEHLALSNYSLGKGEQAAEYAVEALSIHNQYWTPEYVNKRIQRIERISDKTDQ